MDVDELFDGFDGGTKRAAPPATSAPAKRAREEEDDDDAAAAAAPPARKVGVRVTSAQKESSNGKNMTTFSVYPEDYEAPAAGRGGEAAGEDVRVPARRVPGQGRRVHRPRRERARVGPHVRGQDGLRRVRDREKSLRDRDGQRVIYTSPIKALSNQKFRDLQEEFQDVGLMTGDITINPSAKCLVMTTEILRSMLYRGSEVMREVKWVVYDEIHYMRDKERGVVWEESIILLPHSVRFVFLSATIPNSVQFASWIAVTHRQPCHVVYTDYRPTPLVHYVFAAGGEGLHLVSGPAKKKRGGNSKQQDDDLKRIIGLIVEKDMAPAIIFAFSKNQCEANAVAMKKMDFNTDEERDVVDAVYGSAMESLSEEDRGLPQVKTLLPLLKRGVGIHHGGLLPIVKEVVEILFQEGLLKILFATETFAIGINMPAKTVVFTETRKFDGKDFPVAHRAGKGWLSAGEYIQMSGRAGRRGKDDKGTVIQILDEKMEPQVAKDILYGGADALDSSYHVTYNMLLNLLRVEGADPDYLVRSSFHQYQQEADAPQILERAAAAQAGADAQSFDDAADVARTRKHVDVAAALAATRRRALVLARKPKHCLQWLQPGRVAAVVAPAGWLPTAAASAEPRAADFGLGVVVRHRPSRDGEAFASEADGVACGALAATQECLETRRRVAEVLDLRKPQERAKLRTSVVEVEKRLGGDGGEPLPTLRDDDDLKLAAREPEYAAVAAQERALVAELAAHPPGATVPVDAFAARQALVDEARALRKAAAEAQELVLRDDLRRMRKVLKRLGHVSLDAVIALKGRAACELNTADELVIAELLLDGVFGDLEPPVIAALLSCMVFGEKRKGDAGPPNVRKQLLAPFAKLQAAAKLVGKAMHDAKIAVDVDEYVDKFNPDMMELLFEWANGAKFVDVMKVTDAFEGTVIRVIRRLDELLRQLASAAFAIGAFELKGKFEDASAAIKRDIVFAASLYL
ncbi:RNA helicase [Aureococcus anophagefferens]|nr:RNA helicase [Aureococcus anophagefferens]